MGGPRPPAPARRRRSLALRTALGVVVLLAVVLAALTGTSLVLSGRAVDAQLEHQVDQAWERSLTVLREPGGAHGGFPDGGAPEGGSSPDAPSAGGGFDRSPLEAPGQPAGMLALVQVGGAVVEASRLDVDGQAVALSAADVRTLAAVADGVDGADAEDTGDTGDTVDTGDTADTGEARGSGASTVQRVELDSGTYLVRAASVETVTADGQVSGAVAVAGLPTAEVDGTRAALAWVQVIGSLAALVVAGVAAWWWIRRSLRPLAEVSRAAARVAEVPMGSGEVSLARYRVPGGLAQPGDEVGEVGHALNRLVDSVDGAFEQRNRSERRLRSFVADASHELRTPLAAVRGYTEMVRMTEPLTDSGRDSVDRVLGQADRMGSLVEDLLLLARLDAAETAGSIGPVGAPGSVGLVGAGERQAVDLGEIVVDAVMDATAAARDHTWTVDVPADAVTVSGDRRQLEQLTANLLSNARKHTPAGSTVAVRLDVVDPAGPAGTGIVRLEVEDDGPGIDPSLQASLFDRFVRGDAARTGADPGTEGSTGLGLSIVRSVAQAHGGEVRVESVPGRTVFAVELPLALP